MPSYAYSEDVDINDLGLSEDEIRAETDLEVLQGWWDDLETLRLDIDAQLGGYRTAGLNNLPWVYRACQKMGYLGRGQSRIRQRLKALGADPNPLGQTIDRLSKKLQIYRAEAGVAVEFMRIAISELSPEAYRSLESRAVHDLAERLKKEAA